MIFERLRLIEDAVPRDGARNMAVDEMLTEQVEGPMLRVYQWSEPTVTFGYFEKISDVQQTRPGAKWMRRWTGGGVVDHGCDFTYSLIVPTSHPLVQGRRAESYGIIHQAVADFVRKTCDIALELASVSIGDGEGCFQKPVPGDLLWNGRKIAGAAQRRTRSGLLHQGSLLGLPLRPEHAPSLAAALGNEVSSIPFTAHEEQRAEEVATTRYRRGEWLNRF